MANISKNKNSLSVNIIHAIEKGSIGCRAGYSKIINRYKVNNKHPINYKEKVKFQTES